MIFFFICSLAHTHNMELFVFLRENKLAVIAFIALVLLFVYFVIVPSTTAEKQDILSSYVMTEAERQPKKRSVTLVTGFWDVGRNERPATQYIGWLKDTLGMDAKFIVFADKTTNAQLPVDKNKIVTVDMSLEEHPYYKLFYERNKVVLESKKFKDLEPQDKSAVRFRYPGYNVVIWGKAKVLEIAAEMNPFESDYFVWVDAGLSRYWWPRKGDAAENVRWPSNDPTIIKKVFGGGKTGDRITIAMQANHKWKNVAVSACSLPYKGLLLELPGTAGGIIGGPPKALKRFRKLQEEFIDNMLASGMTGTEEQIRGPMHCANKGIFHAMSSSAPYLSYGPDYGYLDVHRAILDGKIEIEEDD